MKNIEVLLDYSMNKEVCYSKNIPLEIGDSVIVDINHIQTSGKVISTDVSFNTKNRVVRKVTHRDLSVIDKNYQDAKNAVSYAKKMKDKLNLNMNFVDSYYTFDRRQLYFLFVADNRVDFRELARRLADKYRTRIELRQIGVRDKAKRVGGIGPCGLFLCCNTFLTDFNSVSINMAKNQYLALNPSKINGVCGRLLCCLNYENDTYNLLKKKAPKVGEFFKTSKGEGKVVNIDLFKETCVVDVGGSNVVVNYREYYESVK